MSNSRYRHPIGLLLLALVLLVSGCSTATIGDTFSSADGTSAASQAASVGPGPEFNATGDIRTIVQEVVNQVRPAVVQVANEQTRQGPNGDPVLVPLGTGSGFIIDAAGTSSPMITLSPRPSG